MKQTSFSHFEKESLHVVRNLVNNAEDKVDLDNYFSRTATEFLNRVFGQKCVINNGDIVFTPIKIPYYKINGKLKSVTHFNEVWKNSDLKNCLDRIASTFHKRYVHIDKHPSKSERKLRN